MTTRKRRSQGSGSVFQRKDGMWIAQVKVWDEAEGRARTIRRYHSTRTGARALLAELREQPGTATPKREVTVADYLGTWRDVTLPRRGLADSTVEQYVNLIRSPLTPTLGMVRLSRFDPMEAERWLARLDAATTKGGKPLSQSTKRGAFAVLSLALDTAVRDQVIESNPLAKVQRPRKGQAEMPVMSAEEVEAVLDAAQGSDIEALVTFIANTGCRLGEALSLRWSEVDLDRASAIIRRSGLESDRTKTKAGRRAVPLVPEVVAALRAERAQQAATRLRMGSGWPDHDLVFPSRVGSPLDQHNARRMMRVVLRKAGLPTNRPWHTMRHSLATRLLNRGVPMPVVSSILGHASIRTTVDLYGHSEPAISAAALAEAMAR